MHLRKATLNDLTAIIALLADDELGSTREQLDTTISSRYLTAFELINRYNPPPALSTYVR